MRFAKLDAEGRGREMEKEGREAKPAEDMVLPFTIVAYTCFSNVVLKRFVS